MTFRPQRLGEAALTLDLRQAVVLLAFLMVAVVSVRVSLDSDTWWHLLAGQWMLDHHAIPRLDSFSWTRAGTEWVDHSWLSEIGFVLVWNRWGFAGLNLAAAALAVTAWVFVYAQTEGSVYLRACVLILAGWAASFYVVARPEMLSFVLLSVFAYVLSLFRRGTNRLWVLPPLMCLWVNLHGGFVVAFFLLGAALAGRGVSWAVGGGGAPAARDLARLAAVALACVAVLPLNPYGPAAVLEPLRTVSIPFLRNSIFEWQSPDFHLSFIRPFAWLLFLTVATLGLSRRRIDVTDLLLVLVFLALALDARRNIPLFALVVTPVIARHASGALEDAPHDYPRLAFLRGLGGHAPGTPPRSAVPWLVLALGAAAAVMYITPYLNPAANEATIATRLPVRAVRFIQSVRPPGPMFNVYTWGGYLAWALFPGYRVYVDGRTDLYGEQFLEAYAHIRAGGDEWRDTFRREHIRLVIIDSGSPLAGLLRAEPGWREGYADHIASVFIAP